MLEIEFSKRSRVFLSRIPAKHAGQVTRKAESLAENPFPQDSKYLKGYALYRADVGEYRIVYYIAGLLLYVYLIGKRNDDEVYKRLKRLER